MQWLIKIVVGLSIICIFPKAGKPWWAAIIPIYNQYAVSDILFRNSNYFYGYLACEVLSIFGLLGGGDGLAVAAGIGYLILQIVFAINLAKVFGKSGLFAVGIIFLPFIFCPIIAWGDAQYTEPY